MYIVNGILYKLASPEMEGSPYGGSFLYAAKAAGQDLRGASAFQQHAEVIHKKEQLKAKRDPNYKPLPRLNVALQAVVDYLGFRLTAQALLPLQLPDNASSLRYGSDDACKTIHRPDEDPEIHKVFKLIAEEMHLAPHVLHTPNHPKHVYEETDERGAEWFFKQENEWALADVLNKIAKVQGMFRGLLLRKKGMGKKLTA